MKTGQTISKAAKQASGPGGGKSPAEIVRASNRWRDNYNPLRGLVIAKVIQLLEAAERGDFPELQLTLRKIEKRYPVLKGLKARRLAALEKLDWDIKVPAELPDGATKALAEAQQKFLRSRYELIENLTEAIGFLVCGEFRGYAILQKHYIKDGGQNDGAVNELHWIPQDQFSRDGQYGDFFYNQNSTFGIGSMSCVAALGEKNRIGGTEYLRDEFVMRMVEDPLYEIALIGFVNWLMGRKDWAAFTEIFGLPNSVAIMPANIPPGKEDEYRAAAEKVADGVSGALPYGADIKFPTASVRGEAPFKSYCDAQDADVVLAGTGGRLSMLTAEKGGLGDGPSQEHADAFDEIAQADARRINSILQRDFDKVELAMEFPGQPALAYFELCAVEEEDATAVVERVAKLEAVGLETDPAEVGEKIGLKLERGAPVVPPKPLRESDPLLPAKIANRDNPQSADDLGAILREMILPVLKRLEAIAAVPDAAIQQHMIEKLLADFPQISEAIQADDSLANKLSPILSNALAEGANKQPISNRVLNGDVPGHEFHGNQYNEGEHAMQLVKEGAISQSSDRGLWEMGPYQSNKSAVDVLRSAKSQGYDVRTQAQKDAELQTNEQQRMTIRGLGQRVQKISDHLERSGKQMTKGMFKRLSTFKESHIAKVEQELGLSHSTS